MLTENAVMGSFTSRQDINARFVPMQRTDTRDVTICKDM